MSESKKSVNQDSVLSKVQEQQIREERKRKSEEVLQIIIYRAVERNEKIDESVLLRWINAYKQKHPGPGNDFEASIVFARALEHLDMYPSSILKSGCPLPDNLQKDLTVVKLLCDLDLTSIDKNMKRE